MSKEVEKDYDDFSHWDTEPVEVKQAFAPDTYTGEEWRCRQEVERKGDPNWEYAPYEGNLDELEIG